MAKNTNIKKYHQQNILLAKMPMAKMPMAKMPMAKYTNGEKNQWQNIPTTKNVNVKKRPMAKTYQWQKNTNGKNIPMANKKNQWQKNTNGKKNINGKKY